MNPDRGISSSAPAAADLPEASGKRTKKAAPAKGKVLVADTQQNPDKLLPYTLNSKTLTVYVTKTSSNPNTASFTTTNQAGTTTGGVALLSPSPNTNVTVDWVLGAGISSLESEVTSVQFVQISGANWSLSFTTPSSSAALGIPFLVHFTTGAPHDPQIIITPISGQQLAKPKKQLSVKRPRAKAPAKRAPAKAKAKGPAKRKAGKKR